MASAPIASLERLKELGLDPAQYGSCSEPEQKSIKNKGRVWINRGCAQWHDCPLRQGTDYMQRRGPGDIHPRPRNVKTTFIKPNSNGPGDRIQNSFCSCFRFLGGLKRRDGRNNEIAEITGGEGDEVTIKTSTRVQNPDNTFYFKPATKTIPVPIFPDPTEVDELFEDIYAAKTRQENKARTTDADRSRRLAGAAEKIEGLHVTEVDPKSV